MQASSTAQDAGHKQVPLGECRVLGLGSWSLNPENLGATPAAQDAAIVGYRSREAGGALRMNPPDDDTLGAGDAIVALAETGAEWVQLPQRSSESPSMGAWQMMQHVRDDAVRSMPRCLQFPSLA